MMNKSKAAHTPEEILAELRALVAEAETMVDKTLYTSDDVVAALRARYEAAQERLLNAYSETKRRAVNTAARADDAIRESPYQSLAIAAGAGMLLGLFLALRKGRTAAALVAVVALTMGYGTVSAQNAQGRGQSSRAGAQSYQMTGTYDLETARGDSAEKAADLATRSLPAGSQRDRAYEDLLRRLEPPTTIAIDRHGRTVTMSSSVGPRASFDADGVTHNETTGNNRTIATRAEFVGERLSVTSKGSRGTDFLVTFEPLDRGDTMLVTRQLDREDVGKPVVVRSYYHRVAAEPRWDVYLADSSYSNSNPNTNASPRRTVTPALVVPKNTRIEALLDSSISTSTSRSGDRFTMTVQAPEEYRDARIDGVIQQVTSTTGSKNAEMRLDFNTLRLKNGQTAPFEAMLSSVRTPGGKDVRVDSENPPSNTANKVAGGAIGAAVGAVIGAVAGGGKGAAIGAVVGGAGGVILAPDHNQSLDLPLGTLVTLITTSGSIR